MVPVEEKQLDSSSMEGRIQRAYHVLDDALYHETEGIPTDLFQQCVGVLVITVFEAGLVLSCQSGTGILLKRGKDGSWSKPCAMDLKGMGIGILLGASTKDMIIFCFDEESLETLCSESGLRLGTEVNMSLGVYGRNYDTGLEMGSKGVVESMSAGFTQGLYLGGSINGSMIYTVGETNDEFYGKKTTPHGILFDDEVDFPNDKQTKIEDVYKCLAKLARVPTQQEIEESENPVVHIEKTSHFRKSKVELYDEMQNLDRDTKVDVCIQANEDELNQEPQKVIYVSKVIEIPDDDDKDVI